MKFLTVAKGIVFAVFALGVLAFFVYGWVTDCPDTAGYVSCAAMR